MPLCRTFVQLYGLFFTFAVLIVLAAPIEAQHAIQRKIRPALASRLQAAALTKRSQGAPPLTHRIIVGLQSPSTSLPSDVRHRIRTLQETVLSAPLKGTLKVRHRYQNLHGFSAEADQAAIEALAQQDAVAAIYLMPVFHASAIQSHPLTATDQVHLAGFTGQGITIAIIDDGIDHDHLVFGRLRDWPNAKILAGHDFADDDDDPRIDCNTQDHGTAVAGVAAGEGLGVTGTAPDATLVFLKVERAEDCGSGVYLGDVVGALDWVLSHHLEYNIKVVSMSFGFSAFDNPEVCDTAPDLPYREAIDQLNAAGITIFAAVGNEGLCAHIEYPACMSKIISVGSVFDDDLDPQTYCISSATCEVGTVGNCGESRQLCSHNQPEADMVPCYVNSASILDLLAPADYARTASVQRGTTESCFRGTSFATPFAAGVAASLLEAVGGSLDPPIIKRILTSTGVSVLDAKNALLKPRIDTYAALHALLGEVTPCPDCPRFTGNVAGPGTMVLPAPAFRSPAGLHQGWVLGAVDADVNLYLLQKWFGVWQIVAGATSSTAIESIRFNGQAGEYVWAIELQRGSGAYDFWFAQP